MIRLNGAPINATIFPDGTSQVWKVEQIQSLTWADVVWDYEFESEFLKLAQLKSLLDSLNIKSFLTITYLPYARQDKEVSNTTTFALHTFANLLNSLNFSYISIVDPHSNVATKLIKNSEAVYPTDIINKIINLTNPDYICYPDKGAKDKYSKIIDYPYIYAEKVRNQLTGEIESIQIIGNPLDQNILIVDDICDGGGTFIKLMNSLLRNLSKETNLYVSHGIFSKGLNCLHEAGIKRVFTKNGEMFEVDNNIGYKKLTES